MKKQPLIYRINVVGMALGIFAVLRIIIPNITHSMGMYANDYTSILAYVVTLAVSSLIPAIFIEKMCEHYPILFKKNSFDKDQPAVVAFGFAVIIACNFLNSVALLPLKKAGIEFPQSSIISGKNGIVLILYYLSISVVPAIVEEIFLRGMVLNRLMPYGRRFAIISSAFVFMLMHTQINGWLPIFAAGVVLACVYVYTDNIYLAMALHFVNNSYSFLMMYIQQYIGGLSRVGAMAFVLMLIMVVGLWRITYIKNKNMNIFSVLKKLEKETGNIKVFFKSPTMILSAGICIFTAINQMFIDLNL